MATESVISKTPDVRYTAKDYQSLRIAIQSDLRNRFPEVKFNFDEPNYLTMMVAAIAYMGDMLAYTADAGVRECFFFSAQLAESIRLHAAQIGYEIPGRVAATASIRLTLQQDTVFPILVPEGSFFTTSDGEGSTAFQTLQDEVIPAGLAGSFLDIFVEHSQNFSATFTANGDPFQEFVTSQRPVLRSGIDGDGVALAEPITITVDTIPYTIVDSFEFSEPTDTHLFATLTNGGRLRIRFGDGRTGVAPVGTVQVVGRIGGGARGNNVTFSTGPAFVNTNGEFITVAVSSSVVSAGGADEPDFATVRFQAPQSLKTNRRTISREDFIINSDAVPGIDRSLPLTYADDPAIPLNSTQVVVLADSPTNAQIVGQNTAATATTDGVDDQFYVSINYEPPQLVDLGTQISGENIAAAIQAAVRAMTPAFPLDNDLAYAGFLCSFDVANERYSLSTGQAGLTASIVISPGAADASVPLKIDTIQQQTIVIGATPSAATIAAVLTALTIDNPVPNTHIVTVVGPAIKAIYLDISVRFSAAASTAALKVATRDDIRERLATFFSPRLETGEANQEVDFGKTSRFSDWISAANAAPGVESINEDTFLPADDVTLTLREFPVLGGVIIRDESTGLPI